MSDIQSRSGGQVLVDALRIHGVKTVFCVPGESFLPVIDALYEAREDIQTIVGRQEGGVAHMAEAWGKLTNEPGVCFVTRGPGATNAAIGIHTARQDSTPLIVFVGQISRGDMGREAWQEIDYRQMYGHIAKWVDQVDDARRLPEMLSRAFHVATNGRPGPVVLAIPEDMLADMVVVPDAPRYQRVSHNPSVSDMAKLAERLSAARKPLVVLGGGAWSRKASQTMEAFAAKWNLPVACGFRRQDLFDNRHPNYAGETGLGMDPKLAARVREADLVLAIGARLGETSSMGYSLYEVPKPRQSLIHVHRDPNELGHVYHADLAIHSGMEEIAEALNALPVPADIAWQDWTGQAQADYQANLVAPKAQSGIDMGEVMRHLRETLPADSILTNGAGNYTLWVQRFYQYRGWRTQLAPSSGTMGYGVPAAIAAKLAHPQRTVIAFAGDGCFLMNGQELATAVQYRANIIIVVVNNGMYGSIRMHQEKHYPERVHATALQNPDFVALAHAYGAYGKRVEKTEDFAAVFDEARKAGRPALIEVRTDPELVSPRATIAGLRKAARG